VSRRASHDQGHQATHSDYLPRPSTAPPARQHLTLSFLLSQPQAKNPSPTFGLASSRGVSRKLVWLAAPPQERTAHLVSPLR